MANSLAQGGFTEVKLNSTFRKYQEQDKAHSHLINQILLTQDKIVRFLRLLTEGEEALLITRQNEDGGKTVITYDTL